MLAAVEHSVCDRGHNLYPLRFEKKIFRNGQPIHYDDHIICVAINSAADVSTEHKR